MVLWIALVMVLSADLSNARKANRGKLRETAYLYDVCACPDVEMVAHVNTSIVYGGVDDFRVNFNMTYDAPYHPEVVTLELKTCTSRALENCQDYITFPVENICKVLEEPIGYNHEILWRLTPPLNSCPIQGSYTAKEFSMKEVIPLIKRFFGIQFTPDNSIYTCDLKLRSKTELLICLRMSGTFRLARVKESKKPSP